MPKNVFALTRDFVKKQPRNVYDMSFANNLSLRFGKLVPVFCKEVVPGDSYRIRPSMGLKFLPMAFPVQTPMRAYLHFFFVRNRNLWKDWQDFIGKTKDGLVPPYLAPSSFDYSKYNSVGSLADYLGVPNVLYENMDSLLVSQFDVPRELSITVDNDTKSVVFYKSSASFIYINTGITGYDSPSSLSVLNRLSLFQSLYSVDTSDVLVALPANVSGLEGFNPLYRVSGNWAPFNVTAFSKRARYSIPHGRIVQFVLVKFIEVGSDKLYCGYEDYSNYISSDGKYIDFVVRNEDIKYNDVSYNPHFEIYMKVVPELLNDSVTSDSYYSTGVVSREQSLFDPVYSPIPLGDSSGPYFGPNAPIRLSALPFRAYESIYNAYYRNSENNPFRIDGVPEYNKYLPTLEGGPDSNVYELHNRNWEFDFLTSAVQSPQQGVAPLVGITMTGTATFQDSEGNTYTAQANVDSEGNIVGWSSHSSDMPVGTLRMLMDSVGTGISINDLRNVNSFQRWLENNIRVGLKYRDQVRAHFGVTPEYKELDMPEFIGGMTLDINMRELNQQSNDSATTPIGSFVGLADAFGVGKHDISHFCDEHGFIIGILSVVPRPVYSQLLPKYFIKESPFDYYFPEFGKIGYQPILQKEVSPLGTYLAAITSSDDVLKRLNNVFGYQRPWYDYISSVDEVHGQFRTTFRDFIMNRTFGEEPQLSPSFLEVDDEQLNDVFLYGGDDSVYSSLSDKIIGSLFFKCSKKTEIPKYGLPSLE